MGYPIWQLSLYVIISLVIVYISRVAVRDSKKLIRYILGAILLMAINEKAWSEQPPSSGAGSFLPGALLQSTPGLFGQQKKLWDNFDNKKLTPRIETPIETKQDESSAPEIEIMLKHIDVQGATKMSWHTINHIILPYEGKKTTLSLLQKNIVEKITDWYISKGYVTTVAFIPPQKIENGNLIIKVDEGYVGEVTYVPKKYYKARAVLPRIAARKNKIFNLSQLQNSIDQINQGQGLEVQASLQPGAKPSTSDVSIFPTVENFPFEITPSFDNMGRPSIGRNRLGFNAIDRNLFGFGDTAYIAPSFFTHSYSVATGYEIPINSHGTRLGFSQARSVFDFKQGTNAYNGASNIYTIYTQQTLYRNCKTNINAELGFSLKDSSFDFLNLPFSHDFIRVLAPAINLQRTDNTGRTIARVETGIGLDVLGATEGDNFKTSRYRAGSQFIRYNLMLLRIQRLPWNTYGVFKAAGQYSPNSLVSLEQFQAGGFSSVRGYQEGRLIGDSGITLTAEWHIPMWFLPETATFLKHPFSLRNNVELVPFMDIGGVFLNNLFSNSATSNGVNSRNHKPVASEWLASTGLGIRVNLGKYIAARLDLAFPLIHVSPDRNYARIHFGLESVLF